MNPSKKELINLMLTTRRGAYPNWTAITRKLRIDYNKTIAYAKKYSLMDQKRQGPIVNGQYLEVPKREVNELLVTKEYLKERLFKKREIDEQTNCWIWSGHWCNYGYGKLTMPTPFNPKCMSVHKVAAYIWLNKGLKERYFAVHRCNVKSCFNPDHLIICSSIAVANKLRGKLGFSSKGEKNGLAKIDLGTALDIRDAIKMGEETNRQIAERLDITDAIVANIRLKRTWKHIWKIKHEYV